MINSIVEYHMYSANTYSADKMLILNNDNNYDVFVKNSFNYDIEYNFGHYFVYNSDQKYALELYADKLYKDSEKMIVIFNKYTSLQSLTEELEQDYSTDGYNPEVSDKVWDENDWFYDDPMYFPLRDEDKIPIGMHGENMWYYKKPDSEPIEEDEEENKETVGVGFYYESSTYIGDVELEEGQRYYMSLDLQANFSSVIQVSCEADNSCVNSGSRLYTTSKDESIHVNQVFTANGIKHPTLRILLYNYDIKPINIGDYIIISNVRFTKSHSDNFIPQDIPSYDMMRELYVTNTAIYEYLAKLMNEESDYKMYNIYKHLYDALMTAKYNKEAFKIGENKYAKSYTEFLESRDAVLYEKLEYFKTLDNDTMHKEISNNIIEVTYALDGIIDTYSYGYIYSKFPAVSVNYIQQYISKIINFFKSWKVHLLGINTLYKFDDPIHNTIKILEDQDFKIKLNPTECVYVYDSVKINPVDGYSASGKSYKYLFGDEWTNITHRFSDCCRPRDRVKIIANYGNRVAYTKVYDEQHIIFNSEDHIPEDRNNELIITSNSAGFESHDNDLYINTDEDENTMFDRQRISEIGIITKDVTEVNKNNE